MEFEDIENKKDPIIEYKDKILRLEAEITKLRKILVENDLEEEIDVVDEISDEELICIKGISQILDLVKNGAHEDSDIKNFDLLHKNLRLIRGEDDYKGKKSKPSKASDVAELIKIVEAKS